MTKEQLQRSEIIKAYKDNLSRPIDPTDNNHYVCISSESSQLLYDIANGDANSEKYSGIEEYIEASGAL